MVELRISGCEAEEGKLFWAVYSCSGRRSEG